MYVLVIFCSRVHRTLYRIPKGSQFANIGVVVVYYKISWKENKNDYFLVTWLSVVHLEPVNYT